MSNNRLDVTSLNEFFNIDGPNTIDVEDVIIGNMPGIGGVNMHIGHTINLGRPTSELQKQRARENALKRNVNQAGENNRNVKWWRIEFNDGHTITMGGLLTFCKEYGYSRAGCRKLINGEWKSYRDIVNITECNKPLAPTSDPVIIKR